MWALVRTKADDAGLPASIEHLSVNPIGSIESTLGRENIDLNFVSRVPEEKDLAASVQEWSLRIEALCYNSIHRAWTDVLFGHLLALPGDTGPRPPDTPRKQPPFTVVGT